MISISSSRRVQHAPLPDDDDEPEGVPRPNSMHGFNMLQDTVYTRDDTIGDIDDDLAAIGEISLNSKASRHMRLSFSTA